MENKRPAPAQQENLHPTPYCRARMLWRILNTPLIFAHLQVSHVTSHLKTRPESEKSLKSWWGLVGPSGLDQAAGVLPRLSLRSSPEPLTPGSPTTPGAAFIQPRHAAPHSPHSEAAFMWKAGASPHAAHKRDCRMG